MYNNLQEKFNKKLNTIFKINVETSDLNPSAMCTSKSKTNRGQIDFDRTV